MNKPFFAASLGVGESSPNTADVAVTVDIAPFISYARTFHTGNPAVDNLLLLKEEHTFKVLAHATRLCREEPVFSDPFLGRSLVLGALYHDVGRFAQFSRFHTFVDAVSCNHGLLGARILKERGFLKAEPPRIRHLASVAVACHNRFRVPAGLPRDFHTVLLGVRDADKLDIMRVMKENLTGGAKGDNTVVMGLTDAPGRYSPAVLAALEEGRVAVFADMRVYNDFRLLLCTWIRDLNFRTSCLTLEESGYLWEIIESLDGLPQLRDNVFKVVRAALEQRLAS